MGARNSVVHRGGRPSLGERLQFGVRVPVDVAQAVIAEAEARGLAKNEYISRIMARHHDFETTMPPRQQQVALPVLHQKSHASSAARRRHYFGLELPIKVAHVVIAEAEARDLARSEYLARIMAKHHGFEATIPARQQPLVQQPDLGIGA